MGSHLYVHPSTGLRFPAYEYYLVVFTRTGSNLNITTFK